MAVAKLNPNYASLQAGYLFPEITRRTNEFISANPGVEIYKLGIGDTTQPLSPTVIDALHDAVGEQSDIITYTGYGAERGNSALREAIAAQYKQYGVFIGPDEVFVSDGAKPDSANIQSIFASESVVAVQDPTFPVYVDTAVIGGKTSGYGSNGRFKGLVYMDCTEENNFFPNVPAGKVDLIYLCNPNNPTGMAATHEQLKTFVDYALKNKAVIIYDAAYSWFVSNNKLPRTIYELDGAQNCAIEINSFSKLAGFTGARLGWTIVPEQLIVEGSSPGDVQALWNRRQSTMFNGASNIVQLGGIAALSKQGMKESKQNINYYMKNAAVICEGLNRIGIMTFGGEHAPFIWARTPGGIGSWDFFDKLLSETHVVGTPGIGFGSQGEGYFRLSAFGNQDRIAKAVQNIEDNLKI